MLRERIALGLVFVLSWSSGAAAGGDQGKYTVIGGPGLATCADWTEARKTDGIVEEQIRSWVAGFLSAYNRYAHDGKNIVEGRDPQELLDWADRFCTVNPDVTVAAASETMIHELNRALEE